MSSKNKVSNKQKDFNHLTEFLWKMLIMAITMLVLFMGTLVPSLFFASFAASKRNKPDNGKILIENEDSDYFIGKMEKEKEKAKPPEDTLENLFDSKETPSKDFFEEVINKSFKNLNMGLYPRIVNFNGYDKVFDPKNTKLIFFSIMMYYILPIVILLYSLVGAVFYMLGKGIAYYNPCDKFVSKTITGWTNGVRNTENNALQKGGYAFLLVAVGIALNIIRYILVKPVIGVFAGIFGGVLYLLKTLYNIYINPLLQGDIFETDKDKINKFDFSRQLQNKETSFFKHIIKKLTLPFLALYCINVAIAASNDFSSSGLMIGTITITLLASFFNYIKKKN